MKEPAIAMPEDVKSKWVEFKSKSQAVCLIAGNGNTNFYSEEIDKHSKTKFYLFYDGQNKHKLEQIKYKNKTDQLSYVRREKDDKLEYQELQSKGNILIEKPMKNEAASLSHCVIS